MVRTRRGLANVQTRLTLGVQALPPPPPPLRPRCSQCTLEAHQRRLFGASVQYPRKETKGIWVLIFLATDSVARTRTSSKGNRPRAVYISKLLY